MAITFPARRSGDGLLLRRCGILKLMKLSIFELGIDIEVYQVLKTIFVGRAHMRQSQYDLKSLYVKLAAARQARTRFVSDNRKSVATFLRDASARRVDYKKQTLTLSTKQARDRKRYRDRSRREIVQALMQNRNERIWGGKRMRRELSVTTRDIRWQVARLLRSSCSDRARNERSRIRDTSEALKRVQRSVLRIRTSVRHSVKRNSQTPRTREVFS